MKVRTATYVAKIKTPRRNGIKPQQHPPKGFSSCISFMAPMLSKLFFIFFAVIYVKFFNKEVVNVKCTLEEKIQYTKRGLPILLMAFIMLGGIYAGIYKDVADVEKLWKTDQIFEPKISIDQAEQFYDGWKRTIERLISNG